MTLRLNGTTGYVELDSPATGDSSLITLPSGGNGTLGRMQLATSQASTSGTFIDFTGIPSWVKRITVMFAGVSTNGVSAVGIQLGSGTIQSSGYNGCTFGATGSTIGVSANWSSIAFLQDSSSAAAVRHGSYVLSLLGSNIWSITASMAQSDQNRIMGASGSVTLSGTLDRIRITTVNGTDTFDTGTINIMYEG